jgi:signal transduction histidine kinase
VKIDVANLVNLYAQTPEIFCLLSGPEHLFEFVNEAHVKVIGFNVTGMKVREAQPESVEVHSILDNVYNTGETAHLREIPVTIGKSQRYFNLTYAAKRNEQQVIDGIMILGKDITDEILSRRAAESLLAMRDMQNTALELTLRESPIGEILDLLVKIVDKQTSPGLSTGFNLTERVSRPSEWMTPIISSKGDVLGTFELYGDPLHITLEDKEMVAIAARTAAVILERHHEVSRRQIAENRLNLALVSADIGFWDWNAKTGHTFLSDTLMHEWGINSETYNNTLQECLDLVHPEDRDRLWSEIQTATFKGHPYDVDYRVHRPDGRMIWVNAKGRLFLDADNNPERLSGICINITDRRRSEDFLRDALRARDEFISIASHELKTPLTSLKLQNQIQLRHIRKNHPAAYAPENVKEVAESADRQIVRILRLIEDMLDVSRIRTGKLSIRTESMNLQELVKDVLTRLEPQLTSEGYETPTIRASEEINGYWDKFRLEQVISNLITNAIRYGLKNSISIELRATPSTATMSISDKGIGIAPEAVERIFDRFERAISSNEVSGLGLGLYISNEIVKAHGGKIWVESTRGQGSTFFVELPRTFSVQV